MLRDSSASALVAGLVVTLVGYSSSLVVVLEAARAAGLDEARTASWVWAISIGSGLSGLVLTLVTRTPIIVAWSTPGAALLIASLGGFSFGEAVGAFIVASVAAAIAGFTGWFGWVMDRVPEPLLQALLAGVLLPFIVNAALSFEAAPLLAGAVAITFFVGKRFFDRYAVLAALFVGIALAFANGSFSGLRIDSVFTVPVFTMPEFNPGSLLTIALPLFVVTMASQNAPGLAVLRFEGYHPNDRLLVGSISTLSALLAPFGNHAINLAAITAAIATSSESHPDRRRRYVAGISAGVAYLIIGSFGGMLTAVFQAIPSAAVTTLAAVALLGSTLAALRGAMQTDVPTGIASLVTLAVTMSGVVLLSAGSAFWGLVAGAAVYLLVRPRRSDRDRGAA
nr:benzoate/H(+) symporter BenE family transporter [Leucobacter ruminantium]